MISPCRAPQHKWRMERRIDDAMLFYIYETDLHSKTKIQSNMAGREL
jgi:hypothetical protein